MEVTPPFDHSWTRKLTTLWHSPNDCYNTLYAVARALLQHESAYHCSILILDNLANNAFLTYKALRSASTYSPHATFVNLSPRPSLLSPSPSMPLIPWYLGCINKIVEKIVFAHFLPQRGGGEQEWNPGFALFSIGLFYSQYKSCGLCLKLRMLDEQSCCYITRWN